MGACLNIELTKPQHSDDSNSHELSQPILNRRQSLPPRVNQSSIRLRIGEFAPMPRRRMTINSRLLTNNQTFIVQNIRAAGVQIGQHFDSNKYEFETTNNPQIGVVLGT